ncbi:hypothetical protein ACFWBN_18690 [Streptomyces sp. NPDC059989]|uniref:glycoside hydrolase family 113 n=1 Tax=Streptomyces sp. NPDC059989 TaxID=3347026 RepID=UPI0036ADBB79
MPTSRRPRSSPSSSPSSSALVAGLVAVLVLALSSCGLLDDPAASPGPETAGAPKAAASAPASAPQVTKPWKEGDPQLGAQVLWYADPAEKDATVRTKARRIVDYIVGRDMNSVSISFPFVTKGITASKVEAGPVTPSIAHLGILLDEAEASGLRTTVRPLLDEQSLMAQDPLAWRGKIKPADPAAWFASYQQFLKPYLELSAQHKVKTFVIGTELSTLENDARWKGVITTARQSFPGEINYAVNWDMFVERDLTMPVDTVGVDAFFPLKQLKDDAPVSAVVEGWQTWLAKKKGVGPGKLDKTLLYEVGAPAENGGYGHPGAWSGKTAPLNLQVQKNWFDAVCQVAQARGMAGLYWWKLDFHKDPAASDAQNDSHDSFLGRPAEESVSACFRQWAGLR